MEGCLVAVREAAAHQRATAAATEQSLREKIDRVSKVASIEEAEAEMNSVLPDLRPLDDVIPETKASSYVAVFNLQRADSIAGRFGEQVKQQMLAAIASQLKAVQGPEDRLLRWKGTSFVMFIVSTAPSAKSKRDWAERWPLPANNISSWAASRHCSPSGWIGSYFRIPAICRWRRYLRKWRRSSKRKLMWASQHSACGDERKSRSPKGETTDEGASGR